VSAVKAAQGVGVPLLLAAVVTAGSPGWSTYRIKRGDTLSDIAHRYHTTVATLLSANDLPGNGHLIIAGETLRVPVSRTAASAGKAKPVKARTVVVRYRVVEGDSLYKIAARYQVKPSVIAATNKLPRSLVVRLGEVLRIPVRQAVAAKPRSSAANTFAGRTYADKVVSAAAHNRQVLASRPQPSQAQIRALIVKTARKHGVDPNLALAVSWQESGWNHRKVSVANAIGAMQVIPSTGDWASQVVGRRLDLLRARDNVTAGVILLKMLTRSASRENAVAGYYQGLASVRKNGMYGDTKRYVANVLALRARFAR
jgi:LysM repeat protein